MQGLAKVAGRIMLLGSRNDLVLWVVLFCLLCEVLVILGARARLSGVKKLVLAVFGVSGENSLNIGSSATCLILLAQRHRYLSKVSHAFAHTCLLLTLSPRCLLFDLTCLSGSLELGLRR